jgi:DNA-binding transcriptional LysR family regulator
LVLAHPTPLNSDRRYYLVLPENTDAGPAVRLFSTWLRAQCDPAAA